MSRRRDFVPNVMLALGVVAMLAALFVQGRSTADRLWFIGSFALLCLTGLRKAFASELNQSRFSRRAVRLVKRIFGRD